MARWQPNARERLEVAALDEFEARGYQNVTVSEIASRAGVTERTFYRHYADKREVLFAGQHLLLDLIAEHLRDVFGGRAWLSLAEAFTAIGRLIDGRAPLARRRQHVVDSTEALRERELAKLDLVTRFTSQALTDAGISSDHSAYLARCATAAFDVAFAQWIDEPESTAHPTLLAERVRKSFASLPIALADEGTSTSSR